MVTTRAAAQQQLGHHQQEKQQESKETSASFPSAAEQEKQLQADRAMISVYRKDWQERRGIGHAICRHVYDVLWWLEHVCGANMLDYEERIVVIFIILAVLVLILLGAYKQGTQLVHLLKELALSGTKYV